MGLVINKDTIKDRRFAIKIESPEHSEKVQKLLFEYGASWPAAPEFRHKVQDTGAQVLYVEATDLKIEIMRSDLNWYLQEEINDYPLAILKEKVVVEHTLELLSDTIKINDELYLKEEIMNAIMKSNVTPIKL